MFVVVHMPCSPPKAQLSGKEGLSHGEDSVSKERDQESLCSQLYLEHMFFPFIVLPHLSHLPLNPRGFLTAV